MSIKSFKDTLLCTAIAACCHFCFISTAAADESRMAGTVHVSKPHKEPVVEDKKPVYLEETTFVSDIDYSQLESYGLLIKVQDGSLGRDLWHGSKRSTLVEYMPDIPSESPYRTMQVLTKRLLLTQTDSKLLKQDVAPEPGQDIMTLRIEKLLETGAFEEAFSLYTRYNGLPYHERFARAGILASFYNKKPAVGCLDAKTVDNEFSDVAFWQQIEDICTYILSKHNKSMKSSLSFPDSKTLQKIVDDKNYKLTPRKLEELEYLSPIEIAVLNADDRLDFSKLKLNSPDELPLHVLALLLNQPSISDEERTHLMIQAARYGLKTKGELATYYKDKGQQYFGKQKHETSLAGYRKIKDWRRLPYLYMAASNAAKGDEQATIVREALELAPTYGTAALWPFANVINDTATDTYKNEVIRIALSVLAESGIKLSSDWVEASYSLYKKNNVPHERAAIFDYFSDILGQKIGEMQSDQGIDFASVSGDFTGNEMEILAIAHEKLDKSIKFHNYDAADTYEKQKGLTSNVDYVMPSMDLTNRLENAAKDQRLGEVVLLSSIALGNTPPDELKADLLRKVLDGLLAVGLTDEAQSLTREVVLGLSVRK